MKKILIIMLGCVAGWFALGEATRVYGRSLVEKEMRAAFASIPLTCTGAVRDDICLAAPDEGRCLSGEYIDYRTIWKRVDGLSQMETLLARKLKELGSGRKLANWLACQGFSYAYVDHKGTLEDLSDNVVHYTGPLVQAATLHLTDGNLRDATGIRVFIPYHYGNSAFTVGESTFYLAQPFRLFTEPHHVFLRPIYRADELQLVSYQRSK